MHYRGAKIQILDLPGIIEGAKDGRGRGRQVPSLSLFFFSKTRPIRSNFSTPRFIFILHTVGTRRGTDL